MPATTMEDIQATKNFSTQSHILANDFHLSNKDADAMLLERVYHRLQSGKEFNDWIVTFSRKDCERTLGNETRYKAEHVDDGYQMDSLANPSTEVAEELSDEVLHAIFKDDRSFQFVTEVLEHGRKQAMATFNLKRQQFNSRLNHKIKYCHDHSELINRVLATDERKELIKQQRLIQVLLDDVDNPEIDDQGLNVMVATFFDYYPQLHDWLENSKEELGLKYESRVVNNFTGAGLDSRLFLQYLYERLDSIDNQLKGSNSND